MGKSISFSFRGISQLSKETAEGFMIALIESTSRVFEGCHPAITGFKDPIRTTLPLPDGLCEVAPGDSVRGGHYSSRALETLKNQPFSGAAIYPWLCVTGHMAVPACYRETHPVLPVWGSHLGGGEESLHKTLGRKTVSAGDSEGQLAAD